MPVGCGRKASYLFSGCGAAEGSFAAKVPCFIDAKTLPGSNRVGALDCVGADEKEGPEEGTMPA